MYCNCFCQSFLTVGRGGGGVLQKLEQNTCIRKSYQEACVQGFNHAITLLDFLTKTDDCPLRQLQMLTINFRHSRWEQWTNLLDSNSPCWSNGLTRFLWMGMRLVSTKVSFICTSKYTLQEYVQPNVQSIIWMHATHRHVDLVHTAKHC